MAKIFDLLGNLEIRFNEFFIKVIHFLLQKIIKFSPQSWKDKFHATENAIINKKQELRDKRERFVVDTKQKALKTLEWTKSKKEEGNLVDSLKDEVKTVIDKIQVYCLSHNYKEIFLKAIQTTMIPVKWFLSKFEGYSTGEIVAGSSLSLAFLLSGVVTYKKIDQIQQTEYLHRRGPASVYQERLGRPAYHNQKKKMNFFTHLKLPVYLKQDGKSLKKISVDFNLTTNYRKTNQFIQKNYSKIQDQLVMNFEPMVPEFILKTEGKEVIREKIKIEINKYLIKNEVEGRVEDVQLIYILGT
jgi:flagellar basal body-associated protein FliL